MPAGVESLTRGRCGVGDGGRRAGDGRRAGRPHHEVGETRGPGPREDAHLAGALRAAQPRDDLHRAVVAVHVQLGACARHHELHVHPAVVRPPRRGLPGGAGVDLPGVQAVEHRRVLGGVRLAAQVLPQVEQLVVGVRGAAERDAGKPRHFTEGDVELDGAVLEAAVPQPRGAFTQQQGGASAIGLDAPLGGADGPRGGVERLLGGLGGGERHDGHGEQRAEAREAGSVVFHAPTLAGPAPKRLDVSDITPESGYDPVRRCARLVDSGDPVIWIARRPARSAEHPTTAEQPPARMNAGASPPR